MNHPGEFWGECDRCKQWKGTLLTVAYARPPRLTPPPVEFVIGPDYIAERYPIDPDDIRLPRADMCRECRELKAKYADNERR